MVHCTEPPSPVKLTQILLMMTANTITSPKISNAGLTIKAPPVAAGVITLLVADSQLYPLWLTISFPTSKSYPSPYPIHI